MAQQTAVDYLVNLYYTEYDILLPSEDFAKAKQMEKEQIMKSYNAYYSQEAFIDGEYLKGEQYYNETYGENKD